MPGPKVAANVGLHADIIVEDYLQRVGKAFVTKDVKAIAALFLPGGCLRDLLICAWEFNSIERARLNEFLKRKGVPGISNIRIDKTKTPPVYVEAKEWIQAFYTFETPIAIGEGVVRLLRDPNDSDVWNALTFSLAMASLKQYPEIGRHSRPLGVTRDPHISTKNWLDARQDESEFLNYDPQVIIVGAGHSGLMLAARLKSLSVRTLVIDMQKRLGDSWRLRYKSLVLHDHIWANYFPYLKYPDDWPVFIPKDKIANWLEIYASVMELNIWLEATVVPGSAAYDDASGSWNLEIRRGDGDVRQMKCHHVIQATGISGEPNIPVFAGMESFRGVITHSSGHKSGESWGGKKAVVVGSCNSGHDIAQDFYYSGADVTMVQRSGTMVISSEKGVPMLLSHAYSEDGPATEESDLGLVSFPNKAALPHMIHQHKMVNEADQELLDGLTRAGFKLDGEGTGGVFVKYWRFGGGYYIDVGCSQLIIDGKVKIKQGQGIERFEETGVRFEDGSLLEADIVVLATGYKSMRETCRKIFGSNVADRTGPVWDLNDQGEIQGVWQNSGHPGFWYMGGGMIYARCYSRYLALQIKAIEEGLVTGYCNDNRQPA